MEYFLLEVHEAFTPPSLKGWFEKLDANGLKTYSRHEMFFVSDIPQMVYTDIMLHPCFMVSQEAKRVIELYEPHMRFQRIILYNQEKKKSKAYHIPVLKPNPPLGNENQQALVKLMLNNEVYILIRLDLAESLLRRDAIGIGLQEIRWASPEENQDEQ